MEIVIAASGRSLDVSRLPCRNVMAVSTAIERIDVPRWWALVDPPSMYGQRGAQAWLDPRIECLRPDKTKRPSAYMKTSLHWALTCAGEMGPSKIILAGVDLPSRYAVKCAPFIAWFVKTYRHVKFESWSNGPINMIGGIRPRYKSSTLVEMC